MRCRRMCPILHTFQHASKDASQHWNFNKIVERTQKPLNCKRPFHWMECAWLMFNKFAEYQANIPWFLALIRHPLFIYGVCNILLRCCYSMWKFSYFCFQSTQFARKTNKWIATQGETDNSDHKKFYAFALDSYLYEFLRSFTPHQYYKYVY